MPTLPNPQKTPVFKFIALIRQAIFLRFLARISKKYGTISHNILRRKVRKRVAKQGK